MFLEQEDNLLLNLMTQPGPKQWCIISQSLPESSNTQCSFRWVEHADPTAPTVRNDPYLRPHPHRQPLERNRQGAIYSLGARLRLLESGTRTLLQEVSTWLTGLIKSNMYAGSKYLVKQWSGEDASEAEVGHGCERNRETNEQAYASAQSTGEASWRRWR
jgi:hypothetical protein